MLLYYTGAEWNKDVLNMLKKIRIYSQNDLLEKRIYMLKGKYKILSGEFDDDLVLRNAINDERRDIKYYEDELASKLHRQRVYKGMSWIHIIKRPIWYYWKLQELSMGVSNIKETLELKKKYLDMILSYKQKRNCHASHRAIRSETLQEQVDGNDLKLCRGTKGTKEAEALQKQVVGNDRIFSKVP